MTLILAGVYARQSLGTPLKRASFRIVGNPEVVRIVGLLMGCPLIRTGAHSKKGRGNSPRDIIPACDNLCGM